MSHESQCTQGQCMLKALWYITCGQREPDRCAPGISSLGLGNRPSTAFVRWKMADQMAEDKWRLPSAWWLVRAGL